MSGNVPDKLKHLEDLSPEEIEKRCLMFEKMAKQDLTDEQLEEVVALMSIHRRKTAGPAKPKSTVKVKKIGLEDFLSGMGT